MKLLEHRSGFALDRALISAFVLCVLSVGCGGGGSASSPTPEPGPTPSLSGVFEYEGITHVSWWFDEYQGASGTNSRQALNATGANWAGLLLTWYMDDRNSTTIQPDSQRTPSESAVIEAIRHLHRLGLKVMLKPHVDVKDDTWRGSVRPSNTASWFASYASYITSMARLAEAESVEMLCVGTEFARLSGADLRNRWAAVIAQVRESYHGRITYAANANSAADEFTSVSFWDLVDLAGLDVYVPLTNRDDPSPADLVAGWTRNRNGDNMLAAYRNWQRSHGKPVIFTEIGYRSANGTNRAPWEYGTTLSYDGVEQADCYYAAFAVWLPERAWMKGIFWWSWDVPTPAANDTGYTPRNKPAGEFLRERFSS
jgi:hypothetical protein